MVQLIKRMTAPVVRLTTVQHEPHQAVFDRFASNIGRVLVTEAVRREPRIVSFAQRRSR